MLGGSNPGQSPGQANDGRISFLSIGTRILLKDTMDQFLRSIGDYRTYYAPNMVSGLRAFSDNVIHVIITEVEYPDGTAYRLVKEIGGVGHHDDDLYIILALEDRSEPLLALATEIEANSILYKPFTAADLKQQIDKYRGWKTIPKEPWELLVREAGYAAREKRFREAEQHFLDALKASPENPVALYKVGQYYASKPDYAMAEKFFRKAVSIRPEYVPALSALGSLFLTKGDLDKADEFLRKAQLLSPLNPDRLIEMVRLYLDRGVEACKLALRIDGNSTGPRFMLGKLLAMERDYPGTIRELERVLPSLRDDAKAEAMTFMALARKLGGIAK